MIGIHKIMSRVVLSRGTFYDAFILFWEYGVGEDAGYLKEIL